MLAEVFGLVGVVMVVLTGIVHILLAMGVWMDAHALGKEGRRVYLLPAPLWGLTTLVMGLVGAAVYWGMNRSTFRRD
ncbi:MAG: hypothetical protein ACTHN5_08800 [Phycisphaerae bacterium]